MTTTSNTDLSPLPSGQFRIYRREGRYARRACAENARLFQVGDYVVECDELLHVNSLKDERNKIQGLVLGHAFIAASAEPLSSRHFTDFFSAADKAHSLEILFEQLFGAFILVLIVDGKTHVYLDAGGTLSAVYSKELGVAGSTATAILAPDQYDALFRRDLYERFDIAREGWFPSGLTAHENVSRLLCNHRLDLDSMSAERHWPTSIPVRSENATEPLTRLAASIRSNLNCVYSNYRASMALTGGNDSRVLLSLSGEHRDKLTTYIVDASAPTTAMDIHLADRIAKRVGIAHKVISPLQPDPKVREIWHSRCGHALGGNNAHLHTALTRLDGVDAIIDGSGAETAKNFFWRKSDGPSTTVTADMIVGRMGLASAPELIASTEQWLEHAPRGDIYFMLDLIYLELRNCPWAYAQSYADPPLRHFSPFMSRRSIQAMFELPISTKKSGGLSKSIMLASWPELTEIPVNKYGDLRDLERLLWKLKKFHLIKKKLRKVLAP